MYIASKELREIKFFRPTILAQDIKNEYIAKRRVRTKLSLQRRIPLDSSSKARLNVPLMCIHHF